MGKPRFEDRKAGQESQLRRLGGWVKVEVRDFLKKSRCLDHGALRSCYFLLLGLEVQIPSRLLVIVESVGVFRGWGISSVANMRPSVLCLTCTRAHRRARTHAGSVRYF